MELKIIEVRKLGTAEAERQYKEFVEKNICESIATTNEGDIYIYYKKVDINSKIGLDIIEQIELLNNLQKQSNKEKLAYTIEISKGKIKRDQLEEKIKNLDNKSDEYKTLEKELTSIKVKIAMSEESLEDKIVEEKAIIEEFKKRVI